jgi:hypothetical protein
MKNYTLKPNKKLWDIFEIKTNLVLETLEYAKAKQKVNFYNSGGVFDGFTPAFFLNFKED